MASKQSKAVKDWWIAQAEAAQANPDEPISELRDRNEHWGDMTAEPGGVDYLETEVAGFPALWAVPKDSQQDRVILALHGGGFISGSIYTHRKLFAHLAKATGARALITEYRKVPEYGHPAPLEDTTAAYRWLLGQEVEPRHIAITGDSAGAGLALTTALHARQLRLPMPAALMLMSAWVDMTVSSDTWESNRDKDPFFKKEIVKALAASFLGDTDAKDPLASPLWADLRGLPPMYIQPGGDEGLAGESIRLAEAARLAGVDTRIEVFPGQLHVFQLAAGRAPEADDAVRKLADWVRPILGLAPAESNSLRLPFGIEVSRFASQVVGALCSPNDPLCPCGRRPAAAGYHMIAGCSPRYSRVTTRDHGLTSPGTSGRGTLAARRR